MQINVPEWDFSRRTSRNEKIKTSVVTANLTLPKKTPPSRATLPPMLYSVHVTPPDSFITLLEDSHAL